MSRISVWTRALPFGLVATLLLGGAVLAHSPPAWYEIEPLPPFAGTESCTTYSNAAGINELGHAVGLAEVGEDVTDQWGNWIDCRFLNHAVIWRNGETVDLGYLQPDVYYANGKGINDYDQVVGQSLGSIPGRPGYYGMPFLWTKGVGMINPAAELEWPTGQAWGINNAGQVAGWSMNWPENPKLPTWFDRPTAWAPDGGIVDPVSGGPTVSGVAEAINDADQMALRLVHEDPPPNWGPRAHFWDPETGLTEIAFPDAPPPGDWEAESYIHAINNAGVAVGTAPRADGRIHAYRFDSATGDIEDLDRGGVSEALGINDRGDVAGWLQVRAPVPVVWTHDGMRRVLPNFVSPDMFYGWATTVNNHGDVVGTDAGWGSIPRVAFDALDQLTPRKTPLADLLSDEDREVWELWDVQDINDAGQIVGVGLIDGKFRGFLMTPQEPDAGSSSPSLIDTGSGGRGFERRF